MIIKVIKMVVEDWFTPIHFAIIIGIAIFGTLLVSFLSYIEEESINDIK